MWLVGGIYGCGYNVLVWLVGVVVRRYIDILTIIINFPYSTCIRSFFGSSIPTSLFIFKMFFLSCIYISTVGSNTPFTLATENGSGTVRHGIRGSVNTIGLRGTVLARHGLKRRAGTVPRSTGSQCKLN